MSARDLPVDDLSLDHLSVADLLTQAAASSTRIDPAARVEGGAVLGDGCVVQSGAVVCRGSVLGRGVRVAPNAVFVEPEAGERGTVVHDAVRIGALAVIHAGLTIGAHAWIKPGAVVEASVPARAIMAGNPAVVVGQVDSLHAVR